MIVYFTGTGNSRYCAELLADLLQEDCVNAFSYLHNGIAAELVSTRPWIFVTPTYAWQLPRIFSDFLRSGRFSGNRDAYFVLTCGSDTGCAGSKNQALCRELGFQYRGTLPVVMPENYIALFDAPGPEQERSILAAARPVLEAGAARIRDGLDFFPTSTGVLDRLKSGVVNTLFYRFYIKASPFTATKACTSCGACTQLCPLNNIRLVEGTPTWGSRCTHCMACICLCPAQAIEYGKISRGKRRYQCPEYKPD